ncbi:MAG: hypothetical protein ACOYM2_18075 [Rectinemataceae bacterium]
MKRTVTPALKPTLREICIPMLVEQAPYFSITHIQQFLTRRGIPGLRRTLIGYLHELVAEGLYHL